MNRGWLKALVIYCWTTRLAEATSSWQVNQVAVTTMLLSDAFDCATLTGERGGDQLTGDQLTAQSGCNNLQSVPDCVPYVPEWTELYLSDQSVPRWTVLLLTANIRSAHSCNCPQHGLLVSINLVCVSHCFAGKFYSAVHEMFSLHIWHLIKANSCCMHSHSAQQWCKQNQDYPLPHVHKWIGPVGIATKFQPEDKLGTK